MSFSKLYGHETIKNSLANQIERKRISNAYIFEGIEGVGKKLCAQIFAKALVCNGDEVPCNRCSVCYQADAHTLPDIVTLIKDADKTQIGVDNVREQIIKEVYLKPRFSKRKVFIIDNGDILSTEAQNALLKVLEEPPSYVTFIICVTSKEKLLPTVLSRSQTVSFFPLPTDVVERYLKENMPDCEDINLFAKLSRGSIGMAKELSSDSAKKERIEKGIFNLINLKKNALAIRQMVDFLTEEKENISEIIEFCQAFLRDCVFLKTDVEESIIFTNKLSDMKQFSQNLTKKKLIRAFDKLNELKISLRQNLNFNATVSETVMRVWEELHD